MFINILYCYDYFEDVEHKFDRSDDHRKHLRHLHNRSRSRFVSGRHGTNPSKAGSETSVAVKSIAVNASMI